MHQAEGSPLDVMGTKRLPPCRLEVTSGESQFSDAALEGLCSVWASPFDCSPSHQLRAAASAGPGPGGSHLSPHVKASTYVRVCWAL